MRKIIEGRLYDTDTAKMIGEPWSPDGIGYDDFDWCEETLYRKRTGEYFLYGEGGPKTRYARPYGQSGWQCGDRIMPLSYEDACDWAEGHLSTEDYEREFGTPDDGGEAVLSVRLPQATYDSIRREASRSGRTMREVIIDQVISRKN